MIAEFARLKGIALSALILGGGFVAGPAFGHTPADPAAVKDLNRLSAAAQIVAKTRVTKVQFKMSAAGNGSPGIPSTFVTFAIESTLRGSAPASLTLRFTGGTDGRGGFLGVEGVPVFEVGDQDILFIADNGMASGCGLAMCEFGRFRVSGGQVYATHGERVLSVTNGQIAVSNGFGPAEFQTVSYPAPSFDDMMKNPAFAASVPNSFGVDARALYDSSAPKTITIRDQASGGINGPQSANATAQAGVSVQSFLSAVGHGGRQSTRQRRSDGRVQVRALRSERRQSSPRLRGLLQLELRLRPARRSGRTDGTRERERNEHARCSSNHGRVDGDFALHARGGRFRLAHLRWTRILSFGKQCRASTPPPTASRRATGGTACRIPSTSSTGTRATSTTASIPTRTGWRSGTGRARSGERRIRAYCKTPRLAPFPGGSATGTPWSGYVAYMTEGDIIFDYTNTAANPSNG